MPQTFVSVAVFALALLPGAMYVWGFERLVGLWGIKLSDRILRFTGVSAIFHALLIPITFWLWDEYVRTGALGRGDIPLYVWPLVLIYVLLPLVAGSFVGAATISGKEWAAFFTGLDPAPRAWDYLFGFRPDGWVRLKLKSGIWLAGAYAQLPDGRRSYASGYPEPQELFLVQAAEVDPKTGEFLFDADGSVRLRESSVLVRWDEIEYLEFIEA